LAHHRHDRVDHHRSDAHVVDAKHTFEAVNVLVAPAPELDGAHTSGCRNRDTFVEIGTRVSEEELDVGRQDERAHEKYSAVAFVSRICVRSAAGISANSWSRIMRL